MRRGLVWVVACVCASSGAITGVAEAAPSIESIKFVTIYNPPGGGTPIRNETPGPSGPSGTGLKDISVDNDPAAELTAGVGFSFDVTEQTVTGQLHISRTDFGGLLGPASLERLPVSVEAVAVLTDTANGKTTRKNVSIGYDSRDSSAPGRFTLDLGSCSTPNCKSTPTTCVLPCKGTRTTLSMNVTAPAESLKLTGELSDVLAGGGRKDPTRATLDFSPVAGASSPLVLTIWGTEKKTGAAADAPVETLTYAAMKGNQDATKASVRVCRLPGAAYSPKQIGDTACDATGYDDQQYDSRTIDAKLDPLPRDIAAGGAGVSVSVADNDLGAVGGMQEIKYGSSHPVRNIHVIDDVVTWSDDGKKREAHRVYDLVDVPTWAKLELLDQSQAAGADEATADQTVTYNAGGQLTSVDVDSTERVDGEVVKRQDLYLQTVPTHLKVVAEETSEFELLPGLREHGYDRLTRSSVGLVEACAQGPTGPCEPAPIGVIEYSTADGASTASPPADIGNAYVYTNKPEGGSQFVKLRLLGAAEGNFKIGRHEHLDPWNSPFQSKPKKEAGMDLLSVRGVLKPTPFRTLAEDGQRVFDVRVNDLPGQLGLTLEPQKGKIDYDGSAPIDAITVDVTDPDGLFKRATQLHVLLESVPKRLAVQYPSEQNDDIDLKVENGEIGKLELTAVDAGDFDPNSELDPESDGLILRDLQGIDRVEGVEGSEDVPDDYLLYARARGLRHVKYTDVAVDRNQETQQVINRKQFALDTTSGRNFVVDLEQTGDIKRYHWQLGYGYGWRNDGSRCDTHVVAKRREKTNVHITSLPPGAELSFDKRAAFGKRECFENAYVYQLRSDGSQIPVITEKEEVTDIRYTAGGSAAELDYELADGSTNMRVNLDTVPARLRFCRADGHECLPTIGDGYGTSLGSLTLDASDYLTVNFVDCDEEFQNVGCDDASARITDLRLKQLDFWGDLDGLVEGSNGDTYWNTADYDYGAPTWNGVPWDDGPYMPADSQPFQDAGTGNKARIRVSVADFEFVPGFYARAAHVYWDWIANDEIGDWSPDGSGTGGTVHCPAGTDWEIDTGWPAGWVDVHEDWCNSGEAS